MNPDCICGHGGGAHSTTPPHACSECDCAEYSQPTNPAERRPTQAAFTSRGYGEGSVMNVPVERRTGERERRTMVMPTDLLHQWKENERRGPADRRSPHEQQNEPSSSPARAPGDEPAHAGPADTAPPIANDPAAPSTLAARSEPRYTRAEALTMVAKEIEDEADAIASKYVGPRPLEFQRVANWLRARAEERSHD